MSNVSRILDNVSEIASLDRQNARSLPPEAYTDPTLWELEQEKILRREWYCVGRVTDFDQPGDYLVLDILGEPIIVWKGKDETIRAFANVCRHRNSILVTDQGPGNKRVLVCPYHSWTYADSGQLRGAPNTPDDFDKAAICLPQYALELWQGFVFVSLDTNPEPLAPRLASLEELVGDTRMDRYEWSMRIAEKRLRASWKIMVENGMDGYHVAYVHPKTLGSNVERVDSPWGGLQWNSSCERRKQAWPTMDGDPEGLQQRNRENTYTLGVFPLLLFSLDCHCLIWYSIFPEAHGECTVRAGVAARSVDKLCSVGSPEAVDPEEYGSWVSQLLGEDAPIVEGLQKAMRTPHASQGRLMPGQEDNLLFFQQYLAARLCER